MDYTYDYCLPVEIPVEKSGWDVDTTSIAIAFVIALVVGALITLGCAKLCMKDIYKHNAQRRSEEMGKYGIEKDTVSQQKSSQKGRKKSKSLKKRLKTAGKKGKDAQLVPVLIVALDDNQPEEVVMGGASDKRGDEEETPAILGSTYGMVDALAQDDLPSLEDELSKQDLHGINNLEKELREENINMMINLLRTMLNQQLSKGKVTPEQYKEVVTNMQTSIDDVVKANQREKEDEEEELKGKIKDPLLLQEAIDNLHPKYVHRMNSELRKQQENMRGELEKGTGLTDEEIEAMLAKYNDSMALLEKKLAVERARQVANFEDRLAKRRAMGEFQLADKHRRAQDTVNLRAAHEPAIQRLIDGGKLLEKQKDELLREYEENVRKLSLKQEDELQKQQLNLAEKLKYRRQARIQELAEQEQREQDSFFQTSDAYTSTNDMLEDYHKLLAGQRDQREDVNTQLDDLEYNEMKKLIKNVTKGTEDDIATEDQRLHDQLQSKAQLSQREIDQIIRIHQEESDEMHRMKAVEKRRARSVLEEKLAQRRFKNEEDMKKGLAEQQALKDQQDATIEKLLASQVELSDHAKNKIMKEHEHNMAAVNNQLQMSRLRQQKMLEQKLNKRKAKIADLERQREDADNEKKQLKEKERTKLKAQLDKQIEDEEKKLAEERTTAAAKLKQKLQEETDLALKEQAQQVSQVIARLEVGQARRQAIIHKQDKKLKELEEHIANQVGDVDDNNPAIDSLLQQHYNQVSNLNDKIQDARERQEQMLMEKLQRKKLKKERDMDQDLEAQAEEDYNKQRQRGAGLASNILSRAMEDQRHRNAKMQLEREMQIELQNQREELNVQLEAELNKEVQEQKKQFLAQIAQMTNVTDSEVNGLLGNKPSRRGSAKPRVKSGVRR